MIQRRIYLGQFDRLGNLVAVTALPVRYNGQLRGRWQRISRKIYRNFKREERRSGY